MNSNNASTVQESGPPENGELIDIEDDLEVHSLSTLEVNKELNQQVEGVKAADVCGKQNDSQAVIDMSVETTSLPGQIEDVQDAGDNTEQLTSGSCRMDESANDTSKSECNDVIRVRQSEEVVSAAQSHDTFACENSEYVMDTEMGSNGGMNFKLLDGFATPEKQVLSYEYTGPSNKVNEYCQFEKEDCIGPGEEENLNGDDDHEEDDAAKANQVGIPMKPCSDLSPRKSFMDLQKATGMPRALSPHKKAEWPEVVQIDCKEQDPAQLKSLHIEYGSDVPKKEITRVYDILRLSPDMARHNGPPSTGTSATAVPEFVTHAVEEVYHEKSYYGFILLCDTASKGQYAKELDKVYINKAKAFQCSLSQSVSPTNCSSCIHETAVDGHGSCNNDANASTTLARPMKSADPVFKYLDLSNQDVGPYQACQEGSVDSMFGHSAFSNPDARLCQAGQDGSADSMLEHSAQPYPDCAPYQDGSVDSMFEQSTSSNQGCRSYQVCRGSSADSMFEYSTPPNFDTGPYQTRHDRPVASLIEYCAPSNFDIEPYQEVQDGPVASMTEYCATSKPDLEPCQAIQDGSVASMTEYCATSKQDLEPFQAIQDEPAASMTEYCAPSKQDLEPYQECQDPSSDSMLEHSALSTPDSGSSPVCQERLDTTLTKRKNATSLVNDCIFEVVSSFMNTSFNWNM